MPSFKNNFLIVTLFYRMRVFFFFYKVNVRRFVLVSMEYDKADLTDFILASLGAGRSFGLGFETRQVLFLMALFCLGQFPL